MWKSTIFFYSTTCLMTLAGCSTTNTTEPPHQLSQKIEVKTKVDDDGDTTTKKKTTTVDVAPDGSKTETKTEQKTETKRD